MNNKFFNSGIRFECQGCGRCCRSEGYEAYVYLNLSERQRIAKHLNISTIKFTGTYTMKTKKRFHLKEPLQNCCFLINNKCTIYEARPLQCRTWPFWPENMKEIIWKREITPSCPGIGKGRLFSNSEISDYLIKEKQYQSGSNL